TWLAPSPLVGGADARARGAMGSGGDAVVTVRDAVATPDVARVAVRAAGGPTGPLDAVSPGLVAANSVDTAINGHGDAVAAWDDGASVWIALRPAGATAFGAPIAMGSIATPFVSVESGIDDAGNVAVAWHDTGASPDVVKYRVRSAGGTLGSTGASASDQLAGDMSLDMSEDGHAVVAWSHGGLIKAATRAPGATSFAPAVDLSDSSQPAGSTQTAVADGGAAAIIWTRSDGTNTIAQVARRSGDGPFAIPLDVSPTGSEARYPAVAVNPAGQVLVSWTADGVEANARIGSVTGAFGPRAAFGSGRGMTSAALSPAGTALVGWVADATPDAPYVAVQPAGGTFGAPMKLNPDGTSVTVVQNAQGVALGTDADGDAVAFFSASTSGTYKIYERFLDAAGPRLGDVTAPSSATAGVAAGFSVAPTDVISPAVATTWSFGDGATATGASVAHAYAAAGTYTATVTATDAVGNATSATRTVTVAAAPPGATDPVVLPAPFLPGIPLKATKCNVPKLLNLKASSARTRLKAAHCALGKVTTPKKYKKRKGLVIRKQSRKAGTTAAEGAKVDVTLGTKPKKKARRK
ncbi:MAG TPA: PKD domain-containing protein, partial [Baekduia sp.]|nr:PKD domain-containing protein [Baekduia sp.]